MSLQPFIIQTPQSLKLSSDLPWPTKRSSGALPEGSASHPKGDDGWSNFVAEFRGLQHADMRGGRGGGAALQVIVLTSRGWCMVWLRLSRGATLPPDESRVLES